MGLDKPFAVQLILFLGNVARGDLGTDVFSNRKVTRIVLEQLPYTIVLILAAIAGATVFGIPLGCYSAVYRNSILDKITGVLSVGVIAIPAFVVAIYALLLFAVALQWLPAIGAGNEGDFVDQMKHLILPALSIGMGWIGYIYCSLPSSNYCVKTMLVQCVHLALQSLLLFFAMPCDWPFCRQLHCWA
jgi:peptide/nickel transport system permease protein